MSDSSSVVLTTSLRRCVGVRERAPKTCVCPCAALCMCSSPPAERHRHQRWNGGVAACACPLAGVAELPSRAGRAILYSTSVAGMDTRSSRCTLSAALEFRGGQPKMRISSARWNAGIPALRCVLERVVAARRLQCGWSIISASNTAAVGGTEVSVPVQRRRERGESVKCGQFGTRRLRSRARSVERAVDRGAHGARGASGVAEIRIWRGDGRLRALQLRPDRDLVPPPSIARDMFKKCAHHVRGDRTGADCEAQVPALHRRLRPGQREDLGATLHPQQHPQPVEDHPGDPRADLAEEGVAHARQVVCPLTPRSRLARAADSRSAPSQQRAHFHLHSARRAPLFPAL